MRRIFNNSRAKVTLFSSLVSILLFAAPAFAINYAVAPIPKLGYLTNGGSLAIGYKLCSYAAGSSTLLATYSDSTGTPNTNPVTLDGFGRANVFISSAAYKFLLYAPGTGNTCNGQTVGPLIWSQDFIRDWGLVAFEAGYISGTGVNGRCAQWNSSNTLTSSSVACGTITGSGTANYLASFSSTSAIQNSQAFEDLSGGPGLYVLKLNEKLLVNGTSSDQPIGAAVTLGSTTIANSAVNARTLNFAATSTEAEISSGHTGSSSTQKLRFGFDGFDGVNAYAPKLTINTDGSTEFAAKISKYNNIATAGIGTTSVFGATSQKAETGADTNVLTYTPPSVAGTYRIVMNACVSAANTATLGWTATWKDSNAQAQAPTNLDIKSGASGTMASTLTATANNCYVGMHTIDIDASGTNIVVKTTFSGTSIAYKASATIEQLQ